MSYRAKITYYVKCPVCAASVEAIAGQPGRVRYHFFHWFDGNHMSMRCRGSAQLVEGVTMSDDRQRLINTVTDYVQKNHGGDWTRAFVAQDTNGDGKLSTDEVVFFLAKAGIGLRVTRWAIALQVVKAMDANADGFIGLEEFQQMTHLMTTQAACFPMEEDNTPTDSPQVAYNRGKSDVKGVNGEGRPYNNPYPDGTPQSAEYTRGYRENIGY